MKSEFKAFASDNWAGVHPEVMAALQNANQGHTPAYGADDFTAHAKQIFKRHFGEDAETLFVFNGTGANVVAIDSATLPFQAIICPESAHINMDECGAIEKITGSRIIPVPTTDGKLTPALLKPYLQGFGVEHHAQPRVLSISQTTEYGTVYSIDEIRALTTLAHSLAMVVHMDGARIANAAAALGCELRAFTTDAGIDVVSFGGTKNGMMFGEAVVFLNSRLAENAKYYRKQNGQLPSKQRYVAAQFAALLEGDLWLRNAMHANNMAKRLEKALVGVKNVQITQPVRANVVFAKLPAEAISMLQEKVMFYVWNEQTSEVRWMTSFDTTAEDVDNFAALLLKA